MKKRAPSGITVLKAFGMHLIFFSKLLKLCGHVLMDLPGGKLKTLTTLPLKKGAV